MGGWSVNFYINSQCILNVDLTPVVLFFLLRVAELLEGKGSSSRGPYQGKCNKLSNKAKAEKLVREFIAGKKSESWGYAIVNKDHSVIISLI